MYKMLRSPLRITTSRLLRVKLLHTTPCFRKEGHDGALSQGHVVSPSQKSQHDPHSQSARAGMNKKKDTSSSNTELDAASSGAQPKAASAGKGNAEGIGMADQVGSGSTSGHDDNGEDAMKNNSKNGEEQATAPGLFDAIKQSVGMNSGYWENAGNIGGRRGFHTSTSIYARPTLGQESEVSKETRGDLPGDQNEHKPGKSPEKDNGEVNAAPDPELPSHRSEQEQRSEDEPKRFPSGARS